jgi:hypothetical protein
MLLLAHLNLDFPDTSAPLQDVTKSFSRSIGRRMKKKKKYWDRRATTSYIIGEALQKMEDFVLFYEVSGGMSCIEFSEYCR